MCGQQDSEGCEQRENLKKKAADCAPQQIQKCHGDVKHHPCCTDETKEEDDNAPKVKEPEKNA